MNLKVPAIEKLLDYTASGIGSVAGPLLAPWRARQEAAAKEITAKGDAKILEIHAEAQAKARQIMESPGTSIVGEVDISETVHQRIQFQEERRQRNTESVVRQSAEQLGDKEVEDSEPDHDWTARFFDCVQDVSSEDMQRLWAKVLSGEVESPGRTSLRTLDVLRNMTQEDARIFDAISGFVIEDFILRDEEYTKEHSALTLSNLLHLQDCGLMEIGPFLMRVLYWNSPQVQQSEIAFRCQDILVRIKKDEGEHEKTEIPALLLTRAGRELLAITERSAQLDYIRDFARFLKAQGCNLTYAKIIEVLPDHYRHAGFSAP